MSGRAGIGLGPEEPIQYTKSDLGTGAGRLVYHPVIELSDGVYIVDTEALQMFNFLNHLSRKDIAEITQQLGIDFHRVPGDTKYEKLVELMAMLRYSQLRNELREIIGDRLNDLSTGHEKNDSENQSLSLAKLKAVLDKDAERKVKTKVWLFVIVTVLFWLLIMFLVWRLGWDVMEPWTYVIGIPILLIEYLYFALTQQQLSPQAIYEQLLKTEKQKKYRHYGLEVVGT